MPDLTADELKAIDFACMVLLEHGRRGRRMTDEYHAVGDAGGVDWMEESLRTVDAARAKLRALLAKHKEKCDEETVNG